jgi:hypothetical protein
MPVIRDLLASVKSQVAMQFNFSAEGVALKRHFEKEHLSQPGLNRKIGLELNGIGRPYAGPAGCHALTGLPVPDLDLVLPTGEQTRVGELLREQNFLLLDLRGSGAFDKLALGALPVRIAKALPVRQPAEHRGLTALLVRPDAYVAWATEQRADAKDAWAQIANFLRVPAQVH